MRYPKIPIFVLAAAMSTSTLAIADDDDEEPFDEARLFFELNDTDGDLGIHGLIDGEGWKWMSIESPDERRKLTNFLLKPAFQLQLPMLILLLSFGFLLLAVMLGNLYFEQTFITMMETTSQTEYLQTIISEQTREFRNLALLLLAVYAVLVLVAENDRVPGHEVRADAPSDADPISESQVAIIRVHLAF